MNVEEQWFGYGSEELDEFLSQLLASRYMGYGR